MSKLSPKALFIIALIISLIAAFLMYNQLSKANKDNLGNSRDVVIATEDIPAKTLITAKMLTTIANRDCTKRFLCGSTRGYR